VKVDKFLETNVPGIFALGDALGQYMFKHSANHEGVYAFQNMTQPDDKVPVDYHAMPHAIFAGPQVASVGLTEEECEETGADFVKSTYRYRDTAMGHALEEDHGFVKFLVERGTGKVLGCHILGPEASTLVHEVIVAMKAGDGSIDNVNKAVHIHPALNEVVQRAAPGPGEYREEHEHVHEP
jgi:dihydrolipoamide dehydrogenase